MTCVNQKHSDTGTGADKQKIQFHSVSPLALIFYMLYVYQAIFDQIDLCLITLIKQ